MALFSGVFDFLSGKKSSTQQQSIRQTTDQTVEKSAIESGQRASTEQRGNVGATERTQRLLSPEVINVLEQTLFAAAPGGGNIFSPETLAGAGSGLDLAQILATRE